MQLATLEVAKPMDHSIGERREKALGEFPIESRAGTGFRSGPS